MRSTNRSIALLGATSALVAPTAIALADEPAADAGHGPLRAVLDKQPTVRSAMRDHLHDRLVRSRRRLSRRAGERHADANVWSNGRLRTDIARLRKELRARAASPTAAAPGGSTASAGLEAIAACESGGNPGAVGGGGAFRGKYQFTYETWAAVGGSGDPAAAPEAEQDRRAAQLMAASGRQNWPVCG